MEVRQQRHIVDILFVIALFCLFTLSAVFLISLGADIYGKTVTNMEENFDTRTALAYVTEKVRQSDAKGQISIGSLSECQALVISSGSGDLTYQTYLYEYDGYLMELMIRQGVSVEPSAGQSILAVSDFQLRAINDKLLGCTIKTDETHSYDLYISLHSGGAALEK